MSTDENGDMAFQLGIDIDPAIEHYARIALGRVLPAGTTAHIRIIRDHDPNRARPVMIRALVGAGAGRAPVHAEGDSPRAAVDALVRRLSEKQSHAA